MRIFYDVQRPNRVSPKLRRLCAAGDWKTAARALFYIIRTNTKIILKGDEVGLSAQNSFFSRLFGKKESGLKADGVEILASPLTGRLVAIENVPDQTFAQKILGDGLAVEPTDGNIYSPVDGEITTLMDTLHALCITSEGGAEILIHVGRDTVALGGKPFTSYVREGQKIKRGDLLLKFDMEAIRAAGLDLTTPIVVSNWENYIMEKAGGDRISKGETLLTLRTKN